MLKKLIVLFFYLRVSIISTSLINGVRLTPRKELLIPRMFDNVEAAFPTNVLKAVTICPRAVKLATGESIISPMFVSLS